MLVARRKWVDMRFCLLGLLIVASVVACTGAQTEVAEADATRTGTAEARPLRDTFPHANSTQYSVPDAASFFDRVNLEYPGLKEVAVAVGKKDYPAAIKAYCAFVAKREHPRRIAKDQTFTGHLERADSEIAKYLEDGKMRADHVWLGKPSQHYAHRNRMGFLMHIANAYAESGDDKYLDAFRVIVAAYINDNPLGIKVEPGVGTPWHILDVSARSSAWTHSLALLQRSKRFPVEERFEIYRSLMQHRRILEHYNTKKFRLSNFRTTALGANVRLLLSFPEWKGAEESLKHCMAKLERHLTEGFNADGFQSEMTPNYHYHVLNGFRNMQKLVHDINGYPGFSDEGVKLIEKGYLLLAALRKPNGALPAFGDAPRRGDTPNASPPDGVKVDYVSRLLPASRLALMKSGSNHVDALYLLFDNAPAGTGTHSHWDYMNVEVFAYGRTLLHDPSSGLHYREPLHDGYYKQTKAHNVVMVDGKSSNRFIRDPKRVYNDAWQTNDTFDYARGVLKEYADVDHVREVLFVKGKYWIIRDTILGDGEHTMEQLFQFDPGTVVIDEATKTITSTYPETANLSIIPVDPRGLTVSIDEGFLADKKNKRHISKPTVRLTRKGNTPLRSTVILFPRRKGDTTKAIVTDYAQTETGIRFTVKVDGQQAGQTFVLDHGPFGLKVSHIADQNTFRLTRDATSNQR